MTATRPSGSDLLHLMTTARLEHDRALANGLHSLTNALANLVKPSLKARPCPLHPVR
ncbi:MAG: hypothetical protein PHI64_00690 [Zoogloea sp.]|uniref:hypothetical protein n=1 Tax=Zoogloea sp. TaxID=49181 RepID=UPI002634769D|nr:hypothetical protein [Zoogloea sp.]MDD2987450.1 hypothetical protein [Zoogloea sp.]